MTTITDDGVEVTCQIAIYAELSAGTWTDITSDVNAPAGMSWGNGIRGTKRTDLLATPSPLTLTLNNSTGKYYPLGPSPLAGWRKGVPIKIGVTYDGREWVQYYGRVIKSQPKSEISANADKVVVTVGDWLYKASLQPIVAPATRLNTTADQAARIVAALSPIPPLNIDFDRTDTTFDTVFDAVKGFTTAYGELGKLAESELGPIYLKRDPTYGETLRIEKASRRNTAGTIKSLPKKEDAFCFWGRNDFGFWLRNDGGRWRRGELQTMDTASSGYQSVETEEGRNHTNRVVIKASPRRVDTEFVVLGDTAEPLPVAAGQTITVKISYIDPAGGGTRISAVTDSIQTPRTGSVVDTTIKSLLHFATGLTDSTGLRAWTQNDVVISENNYNDGYGVQYIASSSPAGGGFGVFGGVANYYATTPDSADFDFGIEDFTLGFYGAIIDVSSATGSTKAFMARSLATYPAWILGYFDYSSGLLKAYMSNNGSSWNIADGKSFGRAQASRWAWLEVGRKDGRFYLSQAGKITDSWYSAEAFAPALSPVYLGLIQTSKYMYMGMDELIVIKGRCLHTSDFTPPRTEYSIYYDEDYWGNTTKTRSGTDITSNIAITLTDIGTESTTISITNSGLVNGYVYCRLRGLGVYPYQEAVYTAENASSIAEDGYVNPITVTQKYQTNTNAGKVVADAIITNEGEPTTDLVKITFLANRSHYWMMAGLLCDVGDLVPISFTRAGISGNYYIQAVDKVMQASNKLYVTWLLRKDFGT